MHNIDENKVLRDALTGLNEEIPPMPKGLHAAWLQKVEDDMEEKRTQKNRHFKTLTRWLGVAAAVVFVISATMATLDDLDFYSRGTDTSSAGDYSNSKQIASTYDEDYGALVYGTEAIEEEYAMDGGVMFTSMARGADTSNAAAAPAEIEKKIIRTASMTIATQTFEDSLNALKDACTGFGGWIESASESTNSYNSLRTAYLTLRLPQQSLDAYLAGTAELGRITNRSESAEDVTESYQDTQSRLATQQALMARLQALITESADLSDLLELENQIADTQYQIDRLQSSLNTTDRQVTYSTVNITLKEERTVELTNTAITFGDRIISALQVGCEALANFVQNIAIFLVAALPFIAIVAVVVIIIQIIKRRKK